MLACVLARFSRAILQQWRYRHSRHATAAMRLTYMFSMEICPSGISYQRPSRCLISKSELILLDNIELLFAVELAQDPLRLLQSLSRNRTVIASWPGTFDGQSLTYAETRR